MSQYIEKIIHLVENNQSRTSAFARDLIIASLQQVTAVVARADVYIAVRRENTVEAAAAA